MERFLRDESETRALGLELAARARPGTVIALIGDLGTGKTTLTKAVAEGLGVAENITSPTFTIIKEYGSGRLPLYHFDLYRIGDAEELYALGFEEYFYGAGVTVVEWADRAAALLPQDALTLRLAYGRDDGERLVYTERTDDADAAL
ncbi:MAG: tRNA (adenosine(37)-N6)-threonylcarbamoyltransferase complex ATPase subunit type 1 TsaE [Clostridiales Family XIII bacterium]|jgi:tRNA threonylcarbamoyladenosine biosynthesis protein TsaE|nr:tRNA (adenosine(37)-N6)-threonylcarbamoyltransferase complex ATPase subunit type 1 TsaE [Clostridiales Family XIII bacterium]